jgi:hypothetical protein
VLVEIALRHSLMQKAFNVASALDFCGELEFQELNAPARILEQPMLPQQFFGVVHVSKYRLLF